MFDLDSELSSLEDPLQLLVSGSNARKARLASSLYLSAFNSTCFFCN